MTRRPPADGWTEPNLPSNSSSFNFLSVNSVYVDCPEVLSRPNLHSDSQLSNTWCETREEGSATQKASRKLPPTLCGIECKLWETLYVFIIRLNSSAMMMIDW